jgi:hypothetical protein
MIVVGGTLKQQCYSEFRAICADITAVTYRILRIRPKEKRKQILLLQKNVRRHTSPRTREAITTMGQILLPNSP